MNTRAEVMQAFQSRKMEEQRQAMAKLAEENSAKGATNQGNWPLKATMATAPKPSILSSGLSINERFLVSGCTLPLRFAPSDLE